MDDLASYEAWKAKQQQNTVGAASVALGAAADANPDQVAGDLTLANEFGKVTGGPVPPVSLVQEHRPVFQSQIDRMRAETVLSSSPRLAEWLRNDPSNAPLAKDDLEGLSFWESLGVVPRGVASALPALNEGFYNVAGTLASIPGKNAVSDWLFSQADVSRGFKSTVAGPTGGWLGEQVQGAAQSIGLMTPGIVATYLSGGAAGPAVAAAYLAPGAVTQGGQSARAAIDAGKSPYQALLYGGQDAAAEVLFERIPVGKLIGDIAQGAGFGKILMGQLSREVPTEVATTLYQNLNQWVTLNPDKPLNDFLAEQPAAVRDTIAQTTLAVLGISGAGAAVSRLGRFADERARAQDAESRVALFQELSGQAVNSKLRARMPDRFRQFIEHATANGPVENVFVPAQEFATYWQGLGIDPHQVVGEMEGVTPDDLDAALAGGGDLRIPTATYAAKLAGTEHDAFMMQNMRFNPDDMTAKEAAEFNAKADEIMQEMWAEAEDRAAEDQRWKAADEKIYDEFVSRARAAGMSTETATAAAVPVVAFYRSRAARMGMDVEDYLAQHALPRIEGAIPQGMQWKDVDGLNRMLAEARTTKLPKSAGRPAADALIALGGIDPNGPAAAELKARDITPKTAPGLFKRGGMKSVDNIPIAEVGRMQHRGVDDGNGYVSEQAWIDALDAEHRGEPWQSANDAAAAKMNAAQLDDIENYLNRIGMSLNNSDAEIRAAIEADQNAPGRMYGQGANDQPLYVVHNLSAEKLRHAASLGGLAAPSLAVARGDIGFDSFGEISLIGDASLANPKTKGVRIFSADVYSPRQPRARFKLDRKAVRSMRAVLDPVAERLGLDMRFSDDEIERDGLSAIEGQMVAKAAWLESIGESVHVVREDPDPKPEPIAGFESITGKDQWDLRQSPEFVAAATENEKKKIAEAATPEVAEAIRARSFGPDGVILQERLVSLARQVAWRNTSIAEWKPTASGRVLSWNTSQAIDKQIGDRIGDFNGWVRETFGGVTTAMFFENEAGRKKDYTLANIVKEMTKTIRNGENWNYGAGNVRAAVAPEFKSLRDVSAARGQITSEEGFGALKDEVNNELFALADKFAPFAGPYGKEFGWGDAFSEFLRDLAKGPRAVAECPWSDAVPPELMDEARAFLEKLKGLPTAYFEIKMQRAVDFSEFKMALVPSNIPADVRKILADAGLELVEYQKGDDGTGRKAALQKAGQKVFFQGPRGQITLAADGSSVIRLFETANLSTLHHELGHLFLSMMQNDAAGGDQGSLAELETVKGWWRENASGVAQDGNRAMPDAKLTAEDVQRAIDTGSTGDVIKDAAIDIGMQEQWARGYEAYLMEGKAPSIELRGVFAKFRAWMISVYKQLLNLQVNINDEIRGVFDRMLATDEEIAKAKRQTGIDDTVFATAEQMGLTADEFERFKKLRLAAEDDAMTRVMREAMAPIRREAEKAFQEEKARITAEVTKRINAAPSFRAFEWIVNGRWLGEDAPKDMPDMRLDRAALVDRYGEGVLATLSRDDVSAKGERARKAGWKRNAYAEGGMDPDEVAGWFGFDSGDALVSVLERIPDRKQAIKDEVAAEIFKLHGDPLNDGTIEQMALDAVHADKRAEVMAAELKAIADVAGADVQMTAKEAKASARQTITRMKVKDAQAAHRFLTAERKAGQEAARLGAMVSREAVWMHAARRKVATKAKAALRDAGTPDAVATQIDKANASTANHNETVQKLIEAKRRQLINHALYMEARNAAEEVEKAENFIKRLNKVTMRERIAGAGRREGAQIDYLAAIDEILDGYDFRKSAGIGRGEQRRGALLAYVEAMKAAGRENELAVPADVLARSQRTPYRLLTVEELRGVVDALKNLQHVALRWNDLIDAQNKRALDEAVAEVTAAIDANLPKRPPGRVRTTGEALRNTARQYLDLVLNATTLLREMDGFKDGGPVYSTLKAPIDAAMDRLALRKQKAAADLEALYAVYTKDERRKMAVRRMIPSLGYSLSKWELIAIALNTGNEGNMQRLTDPEVKGSLTEAQVKAVLGMLDERDANFVQSVWDYVGSFRDDIAARERRATGVEPAWVEASPVEIGGKKLRGGYYPLKYDPRLSARARDDEFQETLNGLQAGRFGKAQTRRGHLEARAKSSGRDVELDMSVLHRHINQVIYDLELSEPVANVWKVLQAGSVRSALSEAGRQADFDTLEAWLLDVGTGQLAAADLANRMARKMKSNFTAAKLAFNLATVASQVSGLSQTMVVVGKRDFLRGLMMWISHGGMVPSVTNGVAGVIGKRPFGSTIEDEIAAKSPFMAERMTTFNKDITDFYDDPALGPAAARWGEIKRDWIGPASFWLMTKTQWHIVDVPSWLGGYQQGLRMFGGDEAKAIAHADDIVKRAQASGLFSDRSAIERGSVSRTTRQNDVVRLFTTLGSYMFAKFNVAYERAAKGGRVISREGVSIASVQEVASMALDMVFLFTVEAVVMALIKGNLPGGDDDEEKGWGQFLAEETAFSVLGTMPFIRDVASFAQGFESGGAYGGLIAEIAKPFKEVAQGEIDKGLVKSIISGTGLATGLPAAQINRAVDAWWRQYLEGDDVAPVEYLLGKR